MSIKGTAFQYLAITAVYSSFDFFQMSLKVNCVIFTQLVVQNGMTHLQLLERSGCCLVNAMVFCGY